MLYKGDMILFVKNGIDMEIINEIYPWQEKYFVLRHNLAVQENPADRLSCAPAQRGRSCTTTSETS